MTDNQKSGAALVAGSLGGILTMAIHPTGDTHLTSPQLDHVMALSGVAHTLAIVSYLAITLGALGLTCHLTARERPGNEDRFGVAAFVVFAFGAIALLIATGVSGFIVPSIWRHMAHDAPADQATWHIVTVAVFQFNQTFARIYSVAAAGAILLWSTSAVRNGGLSRQVAFYGCIVAPVLVALIAVGHLQLDVHGMAIVVVAHALWFIPVGLQLYGSPDQPEVAH